MSTADKQTRWDRHFLALCLAHANMSKDPSTWSGEESPTPREGNG